MRARIACVLARRALLSWTRGDAVRLGTLHGDMRGMCRQTIAGAATPAGVRLPCWCVAASLRWSRGEIHRQNVSPPDAGAEHRPKVSLPVLDKPAFVSFFLDIALRPSSFVRGCSRGRLDLSQEYVSAGVVSDWLLMQDGSERRGRSRPLWHVPHSRKARGDS